MRVRVQGKNKTIANIKRIEKTAQLKIKKQTRDAAVRVEKHAKTNITKKGRVDTGRLRSSITHRSIPGYDGLKYAIGTNVFYGKYVEWGTGIYAKHPTIPGRKTPWTYKNPKTGEFVRTKGMKSKSFLRPAHRRVIPGYKKSIERVLRGLR